LAKETGINRIKISKIGLMDKVLNQSSLSFYKMILQQESYKNRMGFGGRG